ncbi:MAG: D-2-hydroxyacid dehydrogenase family protein [Betaproteobacteria bacterium]|nr:D-2-hydroxyacid dehydrogenase family protein [Betaproteobacteria bacterium]
MRVAILEDYQPASPALACFAKLAAHTVEVFSVPMRDEATIASCIAGFDAVVLIRERTRVTKTLLEKLPNLKLIVQTAKIGPHVDVQACQARGITVCDGTGGPLSTAELTWGLILASARNITQENQRLRQGLWQGSVGFQLAGRKLGFVGYGRIAQRLTRYAQAFEMQVSVWGRESTIARAKEAGLRTVASLDLLCSESDVVSVQLRLNDATRGLIKYENLRNMSPDSMFVNVSRAELVAPGALERALREGRPGRAALDVFENEPVMDAAHPLISLPNVTATPHLGYVERASFEKYFGDAFDAINAFAAGQPIRVVL